MRGGVWLAAAGLAAALGVAAADDGPTVVIDQTARIESLRDDLVEVDAEIARIKTAAFQSSKVETALRSLETAASEAMIEAAPSKADRVRRRSELFLEATLSPDEPALDVEEEKELEELTRELAPLAQSAFSEPDVVERREAFEAHLVSAMSHVDPDSRTLLHRRAQIVRELQALRHELVGQADGPDSRLETP